jgi:hypothetical protein
MQFDGIVAGSNLYGNHPYDFNVVSSNKLKFETFF